MKFGNRLLNLRKAKGWTQEVLAAKLFVSDKTISSWEKNRTEPGLDMIVKLSELLDCSIYYLLFGDVIKNNLETEIKVKLSKEEFDRIHSYLKEVATFLKESRQIDTYYQPTYRKFLKDNQEQIDEWLRIGIRGNKKILNYKKWYNNMYCDEIEVEIDQEQALDKIFSLLGLEKIVVVDKIRFTYWYLNKYEIALDYVDALGYFIEIEVKKYQQTAPEEYDQLLKLAKLLQLNLDNLDKRGYPYHLIYKDL